MRIALRSHGSRRRRLIATFAAGVLATVVLAVSASESHAISDDYCGYSIPSGQQCYQGGGYLYWRYHQASHPYWPLAGLCVQSWTGSNYRTGSGCGLETTFWSFCNFYDWPAGNSSVNWGGASGGRTIFGHADNSTSHSNISRNNGCTET